VKIKNFLFICLLLIIASCLSFIAAYFYLKNEPAPFVENITKQIKTEKPLPLLQYSFKNLRQKEFIAKQAIKVEKILSEDKKTGLYVLLFKYESQGKSISGALNLKIYENSQESAKKPGIIMLRGYAPLENYYSGLGTKNAAAVFAENNYVTLAPDFLGFGESDPEPSNTWEARFIKTVNAVDLIKTVQAFPEIDLSQLENFPIKKIAIDPSKIGIWGHSNGGQIAVSVLEALNGNLPATLWAPVLVPFPYSILYFSDEHSDEGKETRKYLSLFEEDYDVFDFSITQHLDQLHGPIQIQHGTNDDSALVSWTQEFLAKVDLENERRATESSTENKIAPIEIDFYKYPGANHNLQPNWNEAVQKDLSFFAKNLTK
jgi:dienelactone hydrolase